MARKERSKRDLADDEEARRFVHEEWQRFWERRPTELEQQRDEALWSNLDLEEAVKDLKKERDAEKRARMTAEAALASSRHTPDDDSPLPAGIMKETLATIQDAYEKCLQNYGKAPQKTVADEAKCSRSTVQRYWSHLRRLPAKPNQ